MGNKISLQQAKQEIVNRGYIPSFEEYFNNSKRLLMKTKEGYKFEMGLNNLKSGKTPSLFSVNNKYSIENIVLWMGENDIALKLLSNKFEGSNKYLIFNNIDNYKGISTWDNLKKNKKVNFFHINNPYTLLNIKTFIKNNNLIYELLSDKYVGSDSKILFNCDKHGEFATSWKHFQCGHYCPSCAIERNSGENHYNYNPSLSEEDRLDRRISDDYFRFVNNVFERDNYTCQCCGDDKGGNLNAHHLDGYNWCEEKRTEVGNGITLCETCHKKFHKEYGYGNNTKEQYLQYINNKTS